MDSPAPRRTTAPARPPGGHRPRSRRGAGRRALPAQATAAPDQRVTPGVGTAAYARCMFPGGQPDMAQLLQQAQQMQQQLVAAQEELARPEVTRSARRNLGTATNTGNGERPAPTTSPAAVDPDDLETLQDLVVAAVRDAKRAADELTASRMGPLAGGLGGGMGLPGF